MQIAEPLQTAIEELSKLPGVGRKSAFRLALYLLKCNKEQVESLIGSLRDLKEKIVFCQRCFNISVEPVCEICKSSKRDKSIICVVEEASDVIAIEKTNEYNGLYHVLGGVLNPLQGITADTLKYSELMQRLKNENIEEVLLALNPDTEGEATSLYLAKAIKPLGIKVSKLARGLPIGGDLEFADEATIGRALIGRIEL